MDTVTISINGKEIITTPDKTILDAVHESGIDKIPTLCHDKRLEHYTSCFLCVVQVEGMNKLIPSCSTKVANGQNIWTNNDAVYESRKMALELLLSNHYADCIGPCRSNCPAEVDAQTYIALISMGKYAEALQLVKENNPLPLSIGRVCVRDCETVCRRNYIDEPVAVNTLKRYVADLDAVHAWKPQVKERNGKRIAIIGSGPAGLTAAYYLTLEGYTCTIFEKLPELGGMLRYGIPEYRLPKNVLDTEIQWILDLGVDVKRNVELGKDISIKSLMEEDKFDSVFVGVGAHRASKLGLDGEEKTVGVYRGIDFLREITSDQTKIIAGEMKPLSGVVAVVGGGNTAIDAARTALRSGAEKVKIVYRRSIKEMPAHHEEIEAAQKEGIEIHFLTNPKSLVVENDKLVGIECLQMKLVEGKPGERPRPVAVEGSEFIVHCDFIISAIGQAVDTSFVDKDKDLALDKWGTITVNNDTLETSIPGVFAGGDAVTGPLTAISSIAQGKKAAEAIMNFLTEGKAKKSLSKFYSLKHKLAQLSEGEFAGCDHSERERMEELDAAERIHNFNEVEHTVTEEQALSEVDRCLECGCSEFAECDLRKFSDDYQIEIQPLIGELRKFKVDNRHPLIVMDANKCINCGKCVRTCTEILNISALGFVYRGFRAIVKPAMEKALADTNCISCGNCIDVCPTGAIAERFPFKVLGTLNKENLETICNFCSIGCKVNYKKITNDIFYVANSTEAIQDSHNRGYLCTKGRFGHRYLMQKNRVLTPMIKTKEGNRAVSEAEAVKQIAQTVKAIIKKHGNDSVAVIGSPKLSNEELFLLQKFARVGLQNNNVGSFGYLNQEKEQFALDGMLEFTSSTVTSASLNKADVIVLVNSDPTEENLVMELKVKQAKRQGAKVVLINSREIGMTKAADRWLSPRKGSASLIISEITRRLVEDKKFNSAYIAQRTKGFDDLANMLTKATVDVSALTGVNENELNELYQLLSRGDKNVIFIHNVDSQADRSSNNIAAIANYLLLTERLGKADNGVILVRGHNNSNGYFEMGMSQRYLPGLVPNTQTDSDLDAKLNNGTIKALFVFGEDPLRHPVYQQYLKKLELLVVSDSYHTDTVKAADVILPAATYIEQTGGYVNCDHVHQAAQPIVERMTAMDNWQLIALLASEFSDQFSYSSMNDLWNEMRSAYRFAKYLDGKSSWLPAYFGNGFNKEVHQFLTYELDIKPSYIEDIALHYQEDNFKREIKFKIT